MRSISPGKSQVYLLYWYKSTKTDANAPARSRFPASALLLCLISGEYEKASAAAYDMGLLLRDLPPQETLEMLVQLDKLVQLIESPGA